MQSVYLEQIDTRKEIQKLHELIQMVWRQYYGPIMGEGKVNRFLNLKQSPEQIQAEIASEASAYYFIHSQQSKEIIGYLAYHFADNALVIDKLYLIYSLRGQGISHEIIAYFEELASGHNAQAIRLWINEENATGIDIFKHFGFTEFNKRRTPLDQGYVLKEVGLEKKI